MSYSKFTLRKAKEEFQLALIEDRDLFSKIESHSISEDLTKILQENLPLALAINTEKARSELLISPILVELRKIFERKISLFSGVDFNVHYAPRRPGDPAAIIAANAEIKSRLGWQPQHNSIEQMVQHALDWERRLHNRIGDTITPPG